MQAPHVQPHLANPSAGAGLEMPSAAKREFRRKKAARLPGAVLEEEYFVAQEVPRMGETLFVSRKKDGKRLYLRDTWDSDAPPPVAAPASPSAKPAPAKATDANNK